MCKGVGKEDVFLEVSSEECAEVLVKNMFLWKFLQKNVQRCWQRITVWGQNNDFQVKKVLKQWQHVQRNTD